jgi:hypothetical protein
MMTNSLEMNLAKLTSPRLKYSPFLPSSFSKKQYDSHQICPHSQSRVFIDISMYHGYGRNKIKKEKNDY